MNISDVTPKMRVAYIPGHAFGDIKHDDVEHGTVSSHNGINVFVKFVKFVKFDKQVSVLGWDDTTSQSCTPSDLVKL